MPTYLTSSLFEVIMLALATASTSVTISKAKIFQPLRDWVFARNETAWKLISCNYCLSHWFAAILVAIYRPVVVVSGFYLLDGAVSVMVTVSLAAIIGGTIIRCTPFKEVLHVKSEPDPFAEPAAPIQLPVKGKVY